MMHSVSSTINVLLDAGTDMSKTIRIAKKLEVNELWAVQRRLAFLKEIQKSIKSYPKSPLHDTWLSRIKDEIKYLKSRSSNPVNDKSWITDEDIEIARSVPIEQIINFKNGKIQAWCHEDKNPSLHHLTRINRARCFVCNLTFDPIHVLMQRDGYKFLDAVRELKGRT